MLTSCEVISTLEASSELDWMLPSLSGLEVCRQLRRRPQTRDLPIIMLTARAGDQDAVRGLYMGADDYITKPFNMVALLARVRALLRRPDHAAPTLLHVGDLVLDPATREGRRGARPISLTTKEFAVLEVLMRASGRVLTREYIGEHAWDDNFDPMSNVIDVYVARLRKKVDGPDEIPLLSTVRGAGYRLAAPKS
jgi:DNA-binding response OmpR family regulator